MTEIQAVFKDDYQFLEQVVQRNKDWKLFQARRTSENTSMNKKSLKFLSHPKRLNASQFDSDEECEEKPLKEKSLKPLHDNNNEKKQRSQAMEKSYIECSSCENVLTAKSSKENISSKPGILNSNSVVVEDEYFLSDNNLPKKKLKPRQPYIQPEKIDNFDKKFKSLIERSVKVLSKIKVMLETGIPSPDGEEDFNRRTRRSQEFSSRFSRIYLYPLLRQMNEVHNSEKTTSAAWINQKVLSIYQIIWQALQAYYNHLPSSVGKCCSDKLQNLLDQSLDVCQFQQDMHNDEKTENDEFINAMRSHSELLLETLSTFELKTLEKKSNRLKNENAACTKRNNPEMKLKSRFSMYSVTSAFRRDAEWKRSVDLMTKKKFNVKSRYRTASFKHRPPVDKAIIELKPKMVAQKSSGNVKQSPTIPEFREVEVETMIELACPQVPANSALHLNHGSSKQLVRDFDQEDDEYDEICKESELTPNNDDNKLAVKELTQKTSNEKIISITGTKNAKLICIRDDSSLIESEDYSEKLKDKEIMTEKILNSSHTQTKLVNPNKKKCIKISRIRKTQMRSLEMLPKTNAINIIQYKLVYHNHQKNNPMYRKTVNVQPWILMGRISDDILNGILQSVTNELEVNEILENLYNAEFQY